MANQDVTTTVTLKWADARVLAMGLVPRKVDGVDKIVIEVHGVTKDGSGREVPLAPVQIDVNPGQVAAVDNMLARALIELRKKNGLES